MNTTNPLTLVITGSKRTDILPNTSQVVSTAKTAIPPLLVLAHPDMTTAWVSINGSNKPGNVPVVDGSCLVRLPNLVGSHKIELSHGLWVTQQIPGVGFTLEITPSLTGAGEPSPLPQPEPEPNPVPTPTELQKIQTMTWSVCSLSVWSRVNKDLNTVPPLVTWRVRDSMNAVMNNPVFYGFVHNRVFTAPGTYRITATIEWLTSGSVEVVEYEVTVSDNTDRLVKQVYVSSVSGSDSNPGTIDKPVKTIANALTKGPYLFLQRGEVFPFNQPLTVFGCIDVYGQGSNQAVIEWQGRHHETNDLGMQWAIYLVDLKPTAYVKDLIIRTPYTYTYPKTQEDYKYEHDLTPRVFRCSGYNAVIGCTAENVGDFCNMNNDPSYCLFIRNKITSAPGRALRCYMYWVQGTGHCFYYDYCDDSTFEHVSRFSSYQAISVNFCTFKNQDKRGVQDASGTWSGDMYNTGKGVETRQKGVGHYGAYNILAGPAGIGPLGRGDGVRDPYAKTQFVVSHNEEIIDVSSSTDPALKTPLEIWHGTSGFLVYGCKGPRLSFENTETQFGYPASRVIANGLITDCKFDFTGVLYTYSNVKTVMTTTRPAGSIA